MDNINMQLFDRFRLVGRKMRVGRGPGAVMPGGNKFREMVPDRVPGLQREMILGILKKERITKQQDIADVLHVSKSTLSAMVDSLAEDGYVERTSDPADRRAIVLVLTQAGEKRAEEVIEERISAMEFMFRNLTDKDKEELIRLLDKMLGED